jgi:hypothetical protein
MRASLCTATLSTVAERIWLDKESPGCKRSEAQVVVQFECTTTEAQPTANPQRSYIIVLLQNSIQYMLIRRPSVRGRARSRLARRREGPCA